MWIKYVSLTVLLVLGGCSTQPKLQDNANAAPIPEALAQAYNQGLQLLKDEKYASAQSHWQDTAAHWAGFPGVWTNLALSQWHLQQYEQGLASVQQALAIDAEFCSALSLQGVLLREQGQFSQAIASYQHAAQCDPTNADIPYNLGILYDLYLQDGTQALTNYRHAQTLQSSTDETLAMWVTDLQNRQPARLAGEAE